MTKLYPTVFTSLYSRLSRSNRRILIPVILLVAHTANSQAVSGIVTDYNGYWKSSTSSLNPLKPSNSHNLLAFTYNGVMYSTGVNDPLLHSHGETFATNDFWSLPVANISGTINGTTKVGLGEMFDGVTNGPSIIPPNYDIAGYLTDGIKGLNIGTCIANLPAGSMSFSVSSINPSSIGDGVPDILVTQVADPSNSFDRYSFTDAGGNMVGSYKDIVFTSITPIGTWTADFYNAVSNPLVLTGGYTKTDRAMRLWAADLSEFGITAANYQSVRNFRIGLSGVSDVAFVAYSARSFSIAGVLPVEITDFSAKKVNETAQIKWNTQSENNSARFVIEKNTGTGSFIAIDSITAAGNSATTRSYSYTDKQPGSGTIYYRLRTVDLDGRYAYSTTATIRTDATAAFSIQPNPAFQSGQATIHFTTATGRESIAVYNLAGTLLSHQTISKGTQQATIELQRLGKGIFYVVLQTGTDKKTQKLFID